jgi:phosphatidylglycerophosphate synthase
MPGEKDIPSFDKYISYPIADKAVEKLHILGLKPNHITIINFLFRCMILYNFYDSNNLELLFFPLMLTHIIDCFDGKMARKYNQGSKLGAMLDIYLDLLCWFSLSIIMYIKGGRMIKLLSSIFLLLLLIDLYINNYQKDSKTNKIIGDYLEMNGVIMILVLYLFAKIMKN